MHRQISGFHCEMKASGKVRSTYYESLNGYSTPTETARTPASQVEVCTNCTGATEVPERVPHGTEDCLSTRLQLEPVVRNNRTSNDWPDFGITAYHYGTVMPYIGRTIAPESYAGLRPSASDFRMLEKGTGAASKKRALISFTCLEHSILIYFNKRQPTYIKTTNIHKENTQTSVGLVSIPL